MLLLVHLGEGLCICTSFHFPDSGLYLLNGFDFYFNLFWMVWHWKPAIWPGGKKITYHCFPSDAVRLKVLLSKYLTCSFNLSFQISDILDTTYTSRVAWENSTRRISSISDNWTNGNLVLAFQNNWFSCNLNWSSIFRGWCYFLNPQVSWSAASPKRKSPRERSPSHSISILFYPR